ncbi:MAG: LamG-like jellyroll fold domain-containing protein [Bacteroidota bacterium]
MRQFVLLFSCVIFTVTLTAQTSVGLVAHYTFAGNFADLTGNSANGGVASGVPEFACGIEGQAVQLFGGNDFIRIPGGTSNNINREFDTEDFTLSFYFKPVGFNGIQYLISKRDTACDFQNYFYIRYAPVTRTVSAYLRQGNQEVRIDYRIENAACWQNVVLVRDNRRVRLFVNNEFAGEQGSTSRVDIFNSGELTIGSANCLAANETSFTGLIDDVRIYNRALNTEDVASLYLEPDMIINADQRLFLGESINVQLNSNCGVAFAWTPLDGVSDPTIPNPTITPVVAGNQAFTVRITDAESSCIAFDSISLQVIDPTTLDCSEVFLPKAFTPNGIGPAVNEAFGISNPFAIPELVSFEVFDRWGGKVFTTTNVFERWDGTFDGLEVNPGVFLWRVVFRCEGQEIVDSGSVTVLR